MAPGRGDRPAHPDAAGPRGPSGRGFFMRPDNPDRGRSSLRQAGGRGRRGTSAEGSAPGRRGSTPPPGPAGDRRWRGPPLPPWGLVASPATPRPGASPAPQFQLEVQDVPGTSSRSRGTGSPPDLHLRLRSSHRAAIEGNPHHAGEERPDRLITPSLPVAAEQSLFGVGRPFLTRTGARQGPHPRPAAFKESVEGGGRPSSGGSPRAAPRGMPSPSRPEDGEEHRGAAKGKQSCP
jgi:hypothetical protein